MIVLVVLALLPARLIGWVGAFRKPVETLLAPSSHLFSGLARWLTPPRGLKPRDDAITILEEELERYRALALRREEENSQLRSVISDLQAGREYAPDLTVRFLTASVIGAASDLASAAIWVRAGTAQGAEVNTVATVRGVQLFGRVISSTARTCRIMPITARNAGRLQARVMLTEDGKSDGLICQLVPVGDGTLRGPVEDRRDPDSRAPIEPAVGMTVRLDDPDHWPRNARMLLVGKVEQVVPSAQSPLRREVIVRPTVDRLDRVSEVVLRVASEPPAPDGSARGTAP